MAACSMQPVGPELSRASVDEEQIKVIPFLILSKQPECYMLLCVFSFLLEDFSPSAFSAQDTSEAWVDQFAHTGNALGLDPEFEQAKTAVEVMDVAHLLL